MKRFNLLIAILIFTGCCSCAFAKLTEPLPHDYKFKAWLTIKPESDRLVIRILNDTPNKNIIDMKTVHERNMLVAPGCLKISDIEKKGGNKGKVIRAVNRDEVTFIKWDQSYSKMKNNPIQLGPQEYIGYGMRFSKLGLYSRLKKELLSRKKGKLYMVGSGLRPFFPGKSGIAEKSSICMTSPEIQVTEKMIEKIEAVTEEIDKEELIQEKDKEQYPYKAVLYIVPDQDQLWMDIMCIKNNTVAISLKTNKPESASWILEGNNKILFRSSRNDRKGPAEDVDPEEKKEIFVDLQKHQIIGKLMHISETMFFPEIENYFNKDSSKNAQCTIYAEVKLYLPGENGIPEFKTELKSNTVTITREIYNSIIKGAIERIKREKLLKLKKKK